MRHRTAVKTGPATSPYLSLVVYNAYNALQSAFSYLLAAHVTLNAQHVALKESYAQEAEAHKAAQAKAHADVQREKERSKQQLNSKERNCTALLSSKHDTINAQQDTIKVKDRQLERKGKQVDQLTASGVSKCVQAFWGEVCSDELIPSCSGCVHAELGSAVQS